MQLGSALIVTAPMLLAVAVAAELYVVFDKVLANSVSASIASFGGLLLMTAFWYVIPLGLKSHRGAVLASNEGGEQRPSFVK